MKLIFTFLLNRRKFKETIQEMGFRAGPGLCPLIPLVTWQGVSLGCTFIETNTIGLTTRCHRGLPIPLARQHHLDINLLTRSTPIYVRLYGLGVSFRWTGPNANLPVDTF